MMDLNCFNPNFKKKQLQTKMQTLLTPLSRDMQHKPQLSHSTQYCSISDRRKMCPIVSGALMVTSEAINCLLAKFYDKH